MRRPRTLTRARATLAIAGVGLLAAVGVPLVLAAPGVTQGAVQPTSSLATVQDRFELLRSPAGAPAPPPVVIAARHAPESYGLVISDARQSANGTWLIPGASGMCLATRDPEGVGISCTSNTAAEAGELRFTVRNQRTGEERIVGAAPDGSSVITARDEEGKAVAAAPARENTYAMSARDVATTEASDAP
jgi:hypothetical protein